MSITSQTFGNTRDGREVEIFTLRNPAGMETKISNYGCTIVTLHAPDRHGTPEDLVLGFDTLAGYEQDNPYFGALVGRCANRIPEGRIIIDGTEYQLTRNQGEHHLHGGARGFDKVVWHAAVVRRDGRDTLELTYLSKDGEEGYPGTLSVVVSYSLTDDNALVIHYSAETDRATIVSLTNHSYFNLSGHASGEVLDHEIMIDADSFTEICEGRYTTGNTIQVEGTPMDLRMRRRIGERMFEENQQFTWAIGGYDFNWILNHNDGSRHKFAEVYDPASGRLMEAETTLPGVQFYCGNKIRKGQRGKSGASYGPYSGLCLETQHVPNAVNHRQFPSPILRPGERYEHETIYRFSVIA